MAISPQHARGKLGVTMPGKEVSGFQAFGVELVLTSLLVLTMLASIDANKHAARRDYGTAAAMGVVVTGCYLMAVRFNGDGIVLAFNYHRFVIGRKIPPKSLQIRLKIKTNFNCLTRVSIRLRYFLTFFTDSL